MEKINDKLLDATRRLLDLQTEKKNYLKELNDQIRTTKDEIETLARDNA